MNHETLIQEIIQERGIIKLIHVTRKKNLKSIYKHGILPRKELRKKEKRTKKNMKKSKSTVKV